jgi:hypothetical protein
LLNFVSLRSLTLPNRAERQGAAKLKACNTEIPEEFTALYRRPSACIRLTESRPVSGGFFILPQS